LELVVTFLALLELVKQHLIETRQDSLFSEIVLESSGSMDEAAEYSLEFGE
jgi:segregation and condensation protein A